MSTHARFSDVPEDIQASLSRARTLANAGDPSTRSVLESIYPLAEQLGDVASYASAALLEPVGLTSIGVPISTDHRVVARLRNAANGLAARAHAAAGLAAGGPDAELHAQVLVTLAMQQQSSLSVTEYDTLIDDAERLCRASGSAELDDLILAARVGVQRPANAYTENQAVIQDRLSQIEAFDRTGAPLVHLGIAHAFRYGDLPGARRLLKRYEDEYAPLALVVRWSVLRAKAALSFAQGATEPSRRHALAAVRLAARTRLDSESLEHFGFQIMALLRERRKSVDARPIIDAAIQEHPSHPVFRAASAWQHTEVHDVAAATRDLNNLFSTDLTGVCRQRDGLAGVSFAVQASSAIGGDASTDWCEAARELLEPYADQWIVAGDMSLIDGPVQRVMALASSALGDTERALTENASARQSAHAVEASLFVWHATRDRGLIFRSAGLLREAIAELTEVSELYRNAGLERQADWVDTQLTELKTSIESNSLAGSGQPVRGEFRQVDRTWQVSFGDETAQIRHLKGMTMVRALLGSPGQTIAATSLAAIAESEPTPGHRTGRPVSSKQVILDDEAVAAYRQRLDQIISELDRSDRRGDVDDSRRLSGEFDAITQQLATAQGLGGRRRTMSDEGERARVRVTKALKAAIRRVREHAPNLGTHLDASIRTGYSCSYEPDTQSPVKWQL